MKKLKNWLSNIISLHPIIFFVSSSVTLIVGLTISLALTSDHFDSIGETFWWTLVSVMTSEPGYADMYPTTFYPQLVQIIVIILGLGLFGALIAKLSDEFIKFSKRRVLGMMEAKYTNHFIICGWSNKAKEIINEILTETEENQQIVLVANIESDPYPEEKLVHFVKGPIDDASILKRANISKAKCAIVLNEDDSDATTVLSSLTIKNLNPTLHTVSEVSQDQNAIHFLNAGVDEVVVNSTITSQLLFRSAMYNGMSKIVGELLSNKIGNTIYTKDISKDDIGLKYIDIYFKYKKEKELNLLGISRDGDTITNPPNDFTIKTGDKIFFIGKEVM